jgi:cytoskeletal protein RodZ
VSTEHLHGEARRRLVRSLRVRVALAVGALLGALWLAFVGRVEGGDDPVLKDEPAATKQTEQATTPAETTPTQTTATETAPAETTTTEAAPAETTTAEEEPSASTTEQS